MLEFITFITLLTGVHIYGGEAVAPPVMIDVLTTLYWSSEVIPEDFILLMRTDTPKPYNEDGAVICGEVYLHQDYRIMRVWTTDICALHAHYVLLHEMGHIADYLDGGLDVDRELKADVWALVNAPPELEEEIRLDYERSRALQRY